jgi:hypothetical protein
VLQQIETQLAVQGDGDELALNLLAQGRLLIEQYRYGEARTVLAEALGYQDHSAIRKQLEFELARAFYETGRFDQALEMMQTAGVRATDHDRKRPNTVLNNGAALGLLADVQRNLGEFSEMRAARAAQGLYTGSTADYLYRQGLDALAQRDRNRAQELFQRSLRAAQRLGDDDIVSLALLQVCLLNADCGGMDTAGAYQQLLASGVPRLSAEAMYLRARILARSGRQPEALRTLEDLVGEIHFVRHGLPGVLGAWYHENFEGLSEDYLGLLMRTAEKSEEATASLLALTRLRLIAAYDSGSPATDAGSLRHKLAERAGAARTNPAQVAEIKRGMEALRRPFREQFAYLSEPGIRRYLASLGRDEVLLTWHVSGTSAQVWAGRQGRVVRRNVTQPAVVQRKLDDAQARLEAGSEAEFTRTMDSLGRALLGPVSDLLADRIYWIPAGPLLQLPMDALRIDGRHLAETHSVAAVLSFPARPGPAASLQAVSPGSVFLAGNPQDYSSAYANHFETTDEMRTMVDLFVGPNLHVVQGAALLPDEFQEQRFFQAGIAHLAMPGVIDLRHPPDSAAYALPSRGYSPEEPGSPPGVPEFHPLGQPAGICLRRQPGAGGGVSAGRRGCRDRRLLGHGGGCRPGLPARLLP